MKQALILMILLLSFVVISVASARCPYIAGDVNGSGNFNGIDVVFAVTFLKGGPHPPVDCHPYCLETPIPFYAAGDFNGDCLFNGIDVAYMLMHLRNINSYPVRHCPTCPPDHKLQE